MINRTETYEGGLLNGKRHGFGKLYNEEGKVIYAGNWINNEKSGFGTAYLPNRTKYIGEFRDGTAKGIGTIYDESGFVMYIGEVNDYRLCGQGCYYYSDGANVFKREMADGMPVGKDTVIGKAKE